MISKKQVKMSDVLVYICEDTYAVPYERCEDRADAPLREQLAHLELAERKRRLTPFAEEIVMETGDKFKVEE